ncbi:HAMP domain-containing sensor histidine kinase [Paratractidigestivibacter sp.]|uniref:sensor histidine kinase n=1 Tax=Paratractidigestivibacter sp. TaxID=2847316 RepID=UPI002ABE2C67|nr:HAMP domain-containing sensor histidine kinase [Paratractidigestivibacter sp.]
MTVTIITVAFLAGFFAAGALYEWELRRQARAVERAADSLRLSFSAWIPTRGWLRLCGAMSRLSERLEATDDAARHEVGEYLRGLSALSHDMRTPLAGARGYVQLAQGECEAAGGARTEAVGEARGYLASAVRRLDDAERLLDQLADFVRSKDPDRRYAMERVAVLPLLIEVLGGYEPQLAAVGWEPRIDFADEGLAVMADPAALRRVIDNVVSNAMRYGSGDLGFIQRGSGERWSIEMSNNIDNPSQIDEQKMFERLWKSNSARGSNGLGLGLSIARSLAEDMGMTLRAEVAGARVSLILEPAALTG